VTSLRGITMPEAGAATLRTVMSRHCQVLLHDYLGLPPLPPTADPGASVVVEALLRSHRPHVIRALRRPPVSGMLGEARRLSSGAGGAEYRSARRSLDLLLLSELSAAGALPCDVVVLPDAAGWPAILSVGGRTGGTPPATAKLVFGSGRVDLEIDGERRPWVAEPTYFEIESGICFAVRDTNPLLPVQGHPERPGNTVDLGGRPLDEWLTSLRAAFAILREHAPFVHEEMRLALEIVVPTGYDPERHFSVSYAESVGAVYMSLHPNVMTLAEALVHEWQHNKLNALNRWAPLLVNADRPLHASPLRPDLRPLRGVLMAVHAFLPVAALYERMTRAAHPLTLGRDWQGRFREIIAINREAAETLLASGRPTSLGAELLDEIRGWDRYFADYAREHWPP
jgi:HEXXH motif-containing protein